MAQRLSSESLWARSAAPRFSGSGAGLHRPNTIYIDVCFLFEVSDNAIIIKVVLVEATTAKQLELIFGCCAKGPLVFARAGWRAETRQGARAAWEGTALAPKLKIEGCLVST